MSDRGPIRISPGDLSRESAATTAATHAANPSHANPTRVDDRRLCAVLFNRTTRNTGSARGRH